MARVRSSIGCDDRFAPGLYDNPRIAHLVPVSSTYGDRTPRSSRHLQRPELSQPQLDPIGIDHIVLNITPRWSRNVQRLPLTLAAKPVGTGQNAPAIFISPFGLLLAMMTWFHWRYLRGLLVGAAFHDRPGFLFRVMTIISASILHECFTRGRRLKREIKKGGACINRKNPDESTTRFSGQVDVGLSHEPCVYLNLALYTRGELFV